MKDERAFECFSPLEFYSRGLESYFYIRYLRNKDGYRTRKGEEPYCKGTQPDSSGVWESAKRAKWVFDKGAHGRKMAKGKKG
jgi:hypothetical protein